MGKSQGKPFSLLISILAGMGIFLAVFFLTELLWDPGAEFNYGEAFVAALFALFFGTISGIVGAVLVYQRLRRRHATQLPDT